MAKTSSLLGGRNQAPLTDDQVGRIIDTFIGLDPMANVLPDPNGKTVFRVVRDEITNLQVGQIVIGKDVLPGTNIVNPNSSLDVTAVAAHELTHQYRWANGHAINDDTLEHLDEALTSLQAISVFSDLRPLQVRQLAADAMQRLHLFMSEVLPQLHDSAGTSGTAPASLEHENIPEL